MSIFSVLNLSVGVVNLCVCFFQGWFNLNSAKLKGVSSDLSGSIDELLPNVRESKKITRSFISTAIILIANFIPIFNLVLLVTNIRTIHETTKQFN